METDSAARRVSRRGTLKLTAFLALLLLGLIAINSPATFAQSSTDNATTSTEQTANSQTVADVAEKSNPATVTVLNLQVQQNQFSENNDGQAVPVGSGSGYIIDEAGHVVTNNHVVEGGAAYQVTFMDGTTVDATLVGTDPYQDVAVLQLQLADGQKVPGTVSFGDSSKLRVGDEVIAIGSPYGEYANTVTAGIVNATDRSLDTGEGYMLPNLIQHDAEIYPGDSGGPLLNDAGEVIGMNVAKAVNPNMGFSQDDTATNIGFAIESNAVKEIVDQLISTGKVARGYLGIRTQLTTEGQAIQSVETDSPAATAGLQAGDVITKIDGQTIDENHPLVNALIFGHKPGDKVELGVDRNGDEITIDVTLGERPADT
jgi:S1-C subfamily serine protease